MTQQEFTARTLVEVSPEEYEAIQTVYLASDLNKDAFCSMWKKMNSSRVEAAKSENARRMLEQANRDFAYSMLNRYYTHDEYYTRAYEFFNEREQKKLGKIGIEVNCFGEEEVLDIIIAVRRYLGIGR